MIKFNKRGIIILSQYRSGGTQLKQILVRAAEYKGLQGRDRGEVDVNTSNTKFKDELYNKFFTNLDEFKVILLNNPVVVSNVCSTNLIEKLNKEFEIIHLERKDAAKCILSLPLWERFIKKGLFKDKELWTEDNMLEFHNELMANRIPFTEITLGGSDMIYSNKGSIETLNEKLRAFSTQRRLLRCIAKNLGIITMYYEDYENTPEILFTKYLDFLSDNIEPEIASVRKFIKGTYKDKIPYYHSNYSIYYDTKTNEALTLWNLRK